MKLYNLPRHSYFTICPDEEVRVPPDAPPMTAGPVYYFDHIDGMYSFCRDPKGNIVHLAAWTEVEPVPAP